MEQWQRYSAAFGIGALAGIINELAQNPNHWCVTNPNLKALATCTVGNIYGWATMGAVFTFDAATKRGVPWWVQIVGATLFAVAMEGVAGQISKKFHDGEQKWKYPACWVPMFGGSVSLVSTLYFGLGIALFYFAIYRPLLSVKQ